MSWRDHLPHPIKCFSKMWHGALGLSGEERQTLMSWGLLGGVVAMTGVKIWNQQQLYSHWKAGVSIDIEKMLVDGLFSQLLWDTMLQGLLACGLVAIARGGSMLVSITKGGLTADFKASGAAATAMAKDTDMTATVAPPKPDPVPAPAGSTTTTTTTSAPADDKGTEKPQ